MHTGMQWQLDERQVYLTVSKYSTSVFTCIELANGASVLKVYPEITCGSATHTVYMVLGVIGTVIYMVCRTATIVLLTNTSNCKQLSTSLHLGSSQSSLHCRQ